MTLETRERRNSFFKGADPAECRFTVGVQHRKGVGDIDNLLRLPLTVHLPIAASEI